MKKQLIIAGFLSITIASKSQNPGLLVTSGTGGQSGLKFTNINSSTTSQPSNGKVLTVNSNGEVIVVPDVSGSGSFGGAQNGLSLNGSLVEFGGPLGSATAAQLINNREVPMAGNRILFSGTGVNAGNRITLGANPLRIGKFGISCSELTNTGPSESISFSAENNYSGNGDVSSGYFRTQVSRASGQNIGIVSSVSGAPLNFGISIDVNGAGGNAAIGGSFRAIDNTNTSGGCTGVSGSAIGGNNTNYGVAGSATGSVGINYGGSFAAGCINANQGATGLQAYVDYTPVVPSPFASCVAGHFATPKNLPSNPTINVPQTNHAVYAEAPSSSNPVYSLWTNSYAIYTNGDVRFNGTAWVSSGSWSGSDARFKRDVKKLENTLEKINKLNGYSYFFKADEFPEKNFERHEQIGFIAQELQKVFPNLVKEDNKGFLSINYSAMIPVLLEAIKEQQNQINELKQANQEIQHQNTTGFNNSNIEAGFQMSQNEPNPFTHETEVKYTLPQTVNNAFMAVYDLTGKQVTTFEIKEKGNSSITITSERLAAGIYIYSIVADGKIVDSKRMIIAGK